VKKIHKPKDKQYDSNLEEIFHQKWRENSDHPIVFHYEILINKRKWELDFAFPQEKLAIELQGYGTGHLSYAGMKRDTEKHNDLILSGWRILYFMSIHIKEDFPNTLQTIHQMLGNHVRKENNNPLKSSGNGGHTSALIEAARRLRNKKAN
jgi:very-short-patch-repair endonuclease